MFWRENGYVLLKTAADACAHYVYEQRITRIYRVPVAHTHHRNTKTVEVGRDLGYAVGAWGNSSARTLPGHRCAGRFREQRERICILRFRITVGAIYSGLKKKKNANHPKPHN